MTNEDIARVAHEVNRALCRAQGDESQGPWDEAEEWQRESSIRGVEFRLQNLQAPVSAQHDQWMAEKVEDGWRYGAVKKPAKKLHPCLVPFENLPRDQQAKDYAFVAVVNSLAPFLIEAKAEGPMESAIDAESATTKKSRLGTTFQSMKAVVTPGARKSRKGAS